MRRTGRRWLQGKASRRAKRVSSRDAERATIRRMQEKCERRCSVRKDPLPETIAGKTTEKKKGKEKEQKKEKREKKKKTREKEKKHERPFSPLPADVTGVSHLLRYAHR